MKYNAFISYSHSQDVDLAPGIERALEKFAKPTFKRRALRIFRDSNDLSISPDLWSKIEEGLRESEYVVYCASSASARSHYCNKEVEFWLANKSMDNFLLVLTEGEVAWDFEKNDFDWEKTTAVPKLFSGAFKNEPLYVDFRGDIQKDRLNLNDADFKSKLIYIAATLHKRSVGDMAGEGIKQHKRTLRIRNTALIVVFSLMSLALLLTVSSINRGIASKLHFQAKALQVEDPSIALRIEAAALKRYDFSEFRNAALSIINNNTFYKILEENDSTYVSDFSISSQDSLIVVGYNNGNVGLLNFAGKKIQEFKAHDDRINSIALAPDGQSVLTSSDDKTARLWDLEGTKIGEFPNHTERVNKATFTPDGANILTASSDGTLRLWDRNGNTIQLYEDHEFGVVDVSFAADGRSFLAITGGASSESVHLWSIDGEQRTRLNIPWITAAALSPDGETILVGQSNGMTSMLSREGDTTRQFQGPEATVTSVTFAPDNKTVLTASANGVGQQRDIQGRLLNEFKGHRQPINKIGFTPDGNSVVTSSFDQTLRLWALDRIEKGAVQKFGDQEKWIDVVAISSDGHHIFAADEHGRAFLWDKDGNEIKTFDDREFRLGSAQFTNKGRSLLTASKAGASVRIYDLRSNQYKSYAQEFPFHRPMAISPNGSAVFLAGIVSGGVLWDLKSDTVTPFKDVSLDSVAFSPDGGSVLIGGKDGKARAFDLKGHLLKEYEAHRYVFTSYAWYAVTSVAFSPDGKTIAMGSDEDGTIRISSIRGSVLADFKGHEDTVSSLAFSPDGKSLMSVSYDKTARLWDLRGTLLSDFSRQTGEVSAMVFSPDGEAMLIGSTDGKVQLIRFIDVENFLDKNVQPLTSDQRKLYEID